MDDRNIKILVVDPSRIMQSMYSKLLASLGEVTAATTVQEACEWVESHPFQLIITDFMFARGNGLDLIQHVRKSCSAMQTPIVMVSASMDPCLKQDAIKTGANFCMGKPPNFKLLTSTVSQLLTAPFVDATDQDSVYYTAIHWTLDGQFFYFCPELQLLVHAEAEDQAVAQLENLIQGEFTKGRAIKRISPPSVNRSLLKAQNS